MQGIANLTTYESNRLGGLESGCPAVTSVVNECPHPITARPQSQFPRSKRCVSRHKGDMFRKGTAGAGPEAVSLRFFACQGSQGMTYTHVVQLMRGVSDTRSRTGDPVAPRHPARSSVHQLSERALGRVARKILARYFASKWVERTGSLVPKARTHGGRLGLKPPDPWQLLEQNQDNQYGQLLSEIVRRKNIPGRLLCELARLQARATQRKTECARKKAIEAKRKEWETCDLDKEGRARLARVIQTIEDDFPKPDYRQLVASCLRKWDQRAPAPSRASLHRLAAGVGRRELHAYILSIHRRKDGTMPDLVARKPRA